MDVGAGQAVALEVGDYASLGRRCLLHLGDDLEPLAAAQGAAGALEDGPLEAPLLAAPLLLLDQSGDAPLEGLHRLLLPAMGQALFLDGDDAVEDRFLSHSVLSRQVLNQLLPARRPVRVGGVGVVAVT